MVLLIIFIIGLFAATHVLLLVEFTCYITSGKSRIALGLFRIVEMIHILVYPGIFMIGYADDNLIRAPSQLSVYVLTSLCIIVYYYSSWRSVPAPPFFETILNCLLIIGIAVTISFYFRQGMDELSIIFNTPIILLFIIMLVKNHNLVLDRSMEENNEQRWGILILHPVKKFFVLAVLCVPVLVFTACLLIAFGQQPGALIHAFIS